VRVPIPVSTCVLLCSYKLGFGLAQKFRQKSQVALCLGSSDSPVCIGHCTVQCPLDRLGLAWICHCAALSGVHWTVIVRCLVCLIDIYSKCILGKFILGKSTISVISTCHVVWLAPAMYYDWHLPCTVIGTCHVL
jgi:hypothetical protein